MRDALFAFLYFAFNKKITVWDVKSLFVVQQNQNP